MTVVADAAPSIGQVIAAPLVAGAAGPAGGAGPDLAGGFHDPVAEAANPFGRARPVSARKLPPVQPAPRGLVPAQFEPLVMLATGLVFIIGVSVLRRRQRQRSGWGSLPERSAADSGLWP